MKKVRVIPRLDIKGPNLIKGIQLEGLRVIGNPAKFARQYYAAGADELIYSDVVASLYGRNSLHDVIRATALEIFVPLTVGGGVRSTDDVASLLSVGADKVSVNTAAVANKPLISEIANQFGSQCCVIEVQARKIEQNKWSVMVENGREPTGLSVLDWVRQAEEMGAGEILLTSIDRDGTRLGVDIDLIAEVSGLVKVPVIASGGVGKPEDAVTALVSTKLHSIAIGDLFHYGRASIGDVKSAIATANLGVRN
jgi:cyclase